MNGISIMDLASEFFYEFRRFIPGLTVIAFYFKSEVEEGLSKSTGLAIVTILITSWLIGLAINEFTSFIVHCFYVGIGWLDMRQRPSRGCLFKREFRMRQFGSKEPPGCAELIAWLITIVEPPDAEPDRPE
jgi:hypothetical protein